MSCPPRKERGPTRQQSGGCMRIAIVGQKDFGKAVLEAFLARGDTVVGVFCAPEKPGESPDPLAALAYVLQFVPQDFATIPTHGTLQYHPSLLPRYRGPSAINWPLILGDTH